MDSKGTASLLACQMFVLDKCPGVRPIGIGETVRRVIVKAVLVVTKGDLHEAAASKQLYNGKVVGGLCLVLKLFNLYVL